MDSKNFTSNLRSPIPIISKYSTYGGIVVDNENENDQVLRVTGFSTLGNVSMSNASITEHLHCTSANFDTINTSEISVSLADFDTVNSSLVVVDDLNILTSMRIPTEIPSSPLAGSCYFSEADGVIYFYSGTVWKYVNLHTI